MSTSGRMSCDILLRRGGSRPRHLLVLRELLCSLVRIAVGAYPEGSVPGGHSQRLLFANHTSHLDTLTLLAALSLRARQRTRPVAARDYWCKGPLRKWVAEKVLNVVFIDRVRPQAPGDTATQDPLEPLYEALRRGDSLIFFPEGTRRAEGLPGPFKSGLYHLAQAFPDVQLTPVYLENLHRVLPKGAVLPLPLINRVRFAKPMERVADEPKSVFLERAREAVCALAPAAEQSSGSTNLTDNDAPAERSVPSKK